MQSSHVAAMVLYSVLAWGTLILTDRGFYANRIGSTDNVHVCTPVERPFHYLPNKQGGLEGHMSMRLYKVSARESVTSYHFWFLLC